MPTSGNLKRGFRVDKDTWDRAVKAAEFNGEKISDVLRDYMIRYTQRTEAQMRKRDRDMA